VSAATDLSVLITNIEMWPRSGTVTYVRDLALELRRLGHQPAVYTLRGGPVAEELRASGILVVTSIDRLAERPDIIHGHHLATAMSAVQDLPGVPAIAVCHSHDGWIDRPLLHPRVRRYFGVSRVCVDRLIREGVPAQRAELLGNFVDTRRFRARPPLPPRPRRALVFSNHAREDTHLPAAREACRRAGLPLDVVGEGVGHPVAQPESLLAQYDIVFAKAKAALEAMAVGAAVVLCDFSGVGPMVTTAEFDSLQAANFGFESLREPLTAEALNRQIERYDPDEAGRVRDLVRARASLEATAQRLVGVYREVIGAQAAAPPVEERVEGGRARLRLRLYVALARVWVGLTPAQRAIFKALPGVRRLTTATGRHLLDVESGSPGQRA
jgi:glycosyltransferase involved in cell wall biosynthesis